MKIDRLVAMANDVAAFFRTESDVELAAELVAIHLTRFWEPRMKKQIAAHYREGGSGLSPIAAAGVAKLASKY